MTSKTENFYKTEKVAWNVSKPGYLSESGNVTLAGDTVINVDLLKDTDWVWTNIPSTIDTSKLTFADGYKPSTNPLATPFSVRDHKHKLTEINLRTAEKTPVNPIEDNYPPILLTDGLTKMKVYSDFLETFDIYTKVYDGNYMYYNTTVKPAGTIEQITLSHTPNLTTFSVGGSGKLRELYVDDFSHVTSMKEAFYGNNSLEYISPMYLDSCTDLSYMFAHCQFPEVPTTLHNTSNVKSTGGMFMNCKNITIVPLFDTQKVTNMGSMFIGCTNLTSVPLFDTQNVTSMGAMFQDCSKLTSVPLFNTQKVYSMNMMFKNCTSLNSVPLFDTSNVEYMQYTFERCIKLTSVPLFDTSKVKYMDNMFLFCTNLTSVPLFDTSNVTNMNRMFEECTKLTAVPLFDTSKVIDMGFMFYNCKNLTSVPLFDTQNVTDMEYMFSSCKSLTSAPSFNAKNVTNMSHMFSGCTSLTSIPSLYVTNVQDASYMFFGCTGLNEIPILDILEVHNAESMFEDCSNLTSILELKSNYNLENTAFMFAGCSKLTSIPEIYMGAVGLTGGREAWGMFSGCTSLTNCGGFKNLRVDMDLGSCPLTHESAMNVINKLNNYSRTLTFSKVTYDTLSKADIKIATDKGWTIASA